MLRARVLAVLLLVLASEVLIACGEDLPDPPAGARRIRIETANGEMLRAIEVGRGRRVAVLSHGVTGTKEDFYGLASALAADGWRVFAYFARGAGTSTGAPEADREEDLSGRRPRPRTGGKEVLLAGGSVGASLSISMARELEAGAVVSLSAPAGAFDALEAARELRGGIPVFVAAARENQPFATDARSIAAALAVSPSIVDGDGHGSGMLRDHPELIEEVLAFADGSVSRRP
jgi:pimeloyl-ACP methyl ester carboxylesterase